MVSQPSPTGRERSLCAPNRPPFPYEHRLPSWIERLATDRRKSRKRRNGESIRPGRDIGLTATALDVLRCMLRWRTLFPDSCWVARATVAHDRGISEKTVTRIWRALERVGALCSEQYGEQGDPDPREPRNTTGWRHWFPFVRERLRQGHPPDRRPNHERGRRRQGDILSPVGETILSPVGGDILSPNGTLSGPSELRKTTTDFPCARAFEAARPDPEPSSSSFDSPPKLRIHSAEVEPEGDSGPEAGELAELLELAESRFPGVRDDRGLVQRAETEAAQHGPGFGDRWRKALEYVEIRDRTKDPIRNFVGFLAIVANWRHRSLEAIDRDLADERKRHPPKIAPTSPPAAPEPELRPAEDPPDLANLSRAELESEAAKCKATMAATRHAGERVDAHIRLAHCLSILERRPCEA